MRLRIAGLTLLVLMSATIALAFLFQPDRLELWEPLEGPAQPTAMTELRIAEVSDYGAGDENRLAILITNEASNWLGLAHGLKTIGVPFIMTTDVERALNHDVVLAYPVISGREVDADTLRALARYPQNGGTLIATNVLGGGLAPVFGFEDVVESRAHTHLVFDGAYEITADFEALGQKTIKIGSETKPAANPGTNVYLSPLQPPVAVYEDGSAAIVRRDYANGHAYALGIDLGQLLLKGYNFKEDDISEAYANQYQPTLDTLLRLVAAIYREGEPDAVLLGTVPDGKQLSVMLTHDIDYRKSVLNAVKYAEMEQQNGVRATYFIQTKYINDFNDETFLDEDGIGAVRQLGALGGEIASHSVSHSLQFNRFGLGSGKEALPAYRPFVRNAEKTSDASILGELRVSKYILESLIEKPVTAFRPGYLRIPDQLPEALAWSGYKYSSSVTANKSLTHFPFRLMAGRGFETSTDIFEIPITIEDEMPPLMGERLDDAIAIADRLAAYGATMVILSHPDILGHKFDFAEGFIAHVKPFAWIGTVSEFGDWWAARDAIGVDVVSSDAGHTLKLSCPQPIMGLTLSVPSAYGLTGAIDGGAVLDASEGAWLIDCTSPVMTVSLEAR
ncbi:polysaccharide deacetylase family protein [Henriciella litoralis]|uniref:polysaccharide deacetylase family protein n=1 Tax=Henriciella litoralis TaxID=568102 RepID=UPI000A01B870|nr:polysaccharide deacetylase family protein [Henriciella litoralis]